MATKQTYFRVLNTTRDAVLAESSRRAANPLSRGVGLTLRKSLPPDGGLIIDPCNGVVSFLMRFPIDVVFLDAEGRVCHSIQPLVPWRASKVVRGAKRVVELPVGTLARTGTQLGDTVEVCPRAEMKARETSPDHGVSSAPTDAAS